MTPTPSGVELTIKTEGVREALAELRKVDPKLRTQATRELKAAGGRLLDRPKANYPLTAPLSGWAKTGRLGYNPAKAKTGVQIRVGGRTPRGSNVAPIITIVQSNAGAAMYDIAGLRNGSSGRGGPQGDGFIAALNARYGKAQRGLWRAKKYVYENAGDALGDALEKVKDDANRALAAKKGDA